MARAEDTAASNNASLGAEIKTKAQTQIRAGIKIKLEEMQKQNEARREEAKKKMEDLKAKIKEEKNTIKAKIKETRVAGREQALTRFDAAVKRVTDLKTRINEQISKLEAKAVDVTNAKSFIVTAETKLTAIGEKIVEVNALLAISIDVLTAENKTALKTLTKDIETLIKEAHKALNDGIKALKDATRIEATSAAIKTAQ
ncbi:hypothetical protein HYW72_00370 [Candidatus Nomurabacteria bacterium]|nr:hypothetical protein [Candidatus Nomurabacteria bacterium]